MYLFFRWAVWFVPRLPRWFVRLLPTVIGPLAWLCAARARHQATRNMEHVLGVEVCATREGRRRLRRVVRGMFRSSVSNYLDALRLPAMDRREILRHISIEGEEHLTEALALGKGVILFSAHLGPFEYMNRWFAASDYRSIIPVERLKDKRMLDLMLRLRGSSGVTYVPLGGSAPLRTIIQALRDNQIVLITADRAVVGESVVCDFFGAPARLPSGPVSLSLRTGAPLVGAFGWYNEQGQVEGAFTPLTLAFSADERRRAEVLEAALIKRLEQVIGAHPAQWVVFAPVWVESSPSSQG